AIRRTLNAAIKSAHLKFRQEIIAIRPFNAEFPGASCIAYGFAGENAYDSTRFWPTQTSAVHPGPLDIRITTCRICPGGLTWLRFETVPLESISPLNRSVSGEDEKELVISRRRSPFWLMT